MNIKNKISLIKRHLIASLALSLLASGTLADTLLGTYEFNNNSLSITDANTNDGITFSDLNIHNYTIDEIFSSAAETVANPMLGVIHLNGAESPDDPSEALSTGKYVSFTLTNHSGKTLDLEKLTGDVNKHNVHQFFNACVLTTNTPDEAFYDCLSRFGAMHEGYGRGTVTAMLDGTSKHAGVNWRGVPLSVADGESVTLYLPLAMQSSLDSRSLELDNIAIHAYEQDAATPQPVTTVFELPVEVLGEEGTTVSRTFTLTQDQVDNADRIFFMANNLSYQDKGSIQVNGSHRIQLNHWAVKIFGKDLGSGGMQHGAMSSIRFTIPNSHLVAGENTITFRFDRSNGLSIGYRIVKFNLLNDRGVKLLPESAFIHEDPSTWSAPEGYDNDADIAAGAELWYGAELNNHYLTDGRTGNWYGNPLLTQRKIRAKCMDCHTQDGRDLEYFSYSNHSIIERSQFHGLTESEGKQIAAYIRSLDVPRHGRPWNPPYQPGPSVGEKPIEYWAAGAGIDAVLENDADMLPYMFPDGLSQEDIDDYFDSDKMYDTTTMPIALQLPDWKRWLPLVHPKDAFGDYYAAQKEDGSFEDWGHAHWNHNPHVHYPRLRWFLENNDHDAIVAKKGEFYGYMGAFWKSFRAFFTWQKGKPGGWRFTGALADNYLPVDPWKNRGYAQMARTSLARLMAVKFFEIHQEFKLEEMTQRLIAPEEQPAQRQWLHAFGYNVFEVPPHFTAKAWGGGVHAHFHGQWWSTGVLESTTWYELQMVINPGNGKPGTVGPVDFNYHPSFIRKNQSSNGAEPLRYYRAMNNMYQVKSALWTKHHAYNKRVGFHMNQQGPWKLIPIGFTKTLNKIHPGSNLAIKVTNAMLTQLAVQLEQPENHPDTWRRTEYGDWFSLEWKTRTEVTNGSGFAEGFHRFFRGIRDDFPGLDPARISRVIDWCETAWPLMPWDKVRPLSIITGEVGVEGEHYKAHLDDFIVDVDVSGAQSVTKLHGADWLQVAADGSIRGVPPEDAAGMNIVAVRVVDASGVSTTHRIAIFVDGSAYPATSIAQRSSGANLLEVYGGHIGIADAATGGRSVEWRLVPASSGYHYLQHRGSGKRLAALSTTDVGIADSGTQGDAVEWQMVDHDGVWSFMVSKLNGQKLHATSDEGFTVNLVEPERLDDNVQWKALAASSDNRNPVFIADVVGMPEANVEAAYSASIADAAYDLDGDTLSFYKMSGPGWLSVAEDGTLGGTPLAGNMGRNRWTIGVSDGNEGWKEMTLFIVVEYTDKINIALNKPAIVDSVLDERYLGHFAVDGKRDSNLTRWVSAGGDSPHWIEIDLEGFYDVDGVRFWTGKDGYNRAISDFQFQYWDGSEWVDVFAETGNTYADYQKTFEPVATDRVRLYATTTASDNYFRLYEIKVYGREHVPNVALHKPVTVDSEYSSDTASSQAVDGENSGNESRWISSDSDWPHWIEVDLQEEYSINRVKFWTGRDGYNSAPRRLQFQYWDGNDWVDIFREVQNKDPRYSRTFDSVVTNKVRLYATSGIDNFFRLYEIEVYGRPATDQ